MFKDFLWRTVFCVGSVAISLIIVGIAAWNYTRESPTGLRFNLGVDLAGGTILVYEVDPDWWNTSAEREQFQSADLASALKRRIDPNNLMEITIRPVETTPPRVEIILPMKSAGAGTQGAGDIERVKSIVSQVGKLEFRILADTRDDQTEIDEAKKLAQDFVADKKNVPDAPNGFAWVEVSPSEAKDRQYENVTEKGFRIEQQPQGAVAAYHALDLNPARHFLLTEKKDEDEQVTGEHLSSARPDVSSGRWVVAFSLNAEGSERFWELTKPVKHYLAIILDNKVESAPILNDRLRDGGIIQMGGGDGKDVKNKVDDLVKILRSGALPATLKRDPVSELTMGPGLGDDTIRKGTIATIISFFAVVGFMVVYYRFAGFVASVALFANLLLTIAFMVMVKATFTLPGLAGLVLMVGMAVDANVLIYERIREERERGSSLALAIRNGYDRAFATIIDTHLTSIFTAIVLYVVGNDQLKGFGVSLTAGLIISLFTSLYMTRLMFDAFLTKNWLRELKMMKMLTKPNLDFMRVRYYWFTATVVLSILGVAVFAARRERGLNIDFTGGTAYHVVFKEPKRIEDVREAVQSAKNADGTPKLENVSVDALYRIDTPAGRPNEFVFRTTLKDPELVRQAVADTFGNKPNDSQLEWVQVRAEPVKKVPDQRLSNQVEFSFTDTSGKPRYVAEAEVQRVVGRWFESKLKVPVPDDYFIAKGVGTAEKDLYKSVLLNFNLPEGVAEADKLREDLRRQVVAGLTQPKSERLENFDSQLAGETQRQALYAIALSWLAVCMYLWFRFGNWTFGLAAVLCLIHDLMFAVGLIGVCHWLVRLPIPSGVILLLLAAGVGWLALVVARRHFLGAMLPLLIAAGLAIAAFWQWSTPMGELLLLEDFKLDLAAVAALLTLVGYSVNDTIVVFDRIREVRGKSPELTPQMINDSVNQTLSRTLLTGISTFLVVIVLYIWGGEGVHLFSYIMIVGVIIGTYSSIYVASPLLLMFGEGKHAQRVRRPELAGARA